MSADDTPDCPGCGAQIGQLESAYVCLEGAWMWSHEHDVEIFVLNPDTQMAVIELDNGQLAIVTDRSVTRHIDKECFEEHFEEEEDEEDRFFDYMR